MTEILRLDERAVTRARAKLHDGVPGVVLKERPFIDDRPAERPGWDARSRWGSRPTREFGRDVGRGGR